MKKSFLPLLLLAACSGGDGGNNMAASDQRSASAAPKAARPGEPPALTTLVGLYEGGESSRPHRMCVVEEGGGTRFGLVVWGGNDHSCSGAGTVTREGATLRLAMTGDSACTIPATISGKTVTLPSELPAGCSYYCGASADMKGVSLTQTGTTEAEAAKAQDLVGEPLCGQ
jgi:hypothetical protein